MSGHGGLWTRGSTLGPMGEDRPRNTCMLGSECHRGDIHVPALLEPSRPITLGVGLFVDDTQICAGAVHQERSQVAIALAGNRPEPLDVRVASGGHQLCPLLPLDCVERSLRREGRQTPCLHLSTQLACFRLEPGKLSDVPPGDGGFSATPAPPPLGVLNLQFEEVMACETQLLRVVSNPHVGARCGVGPASAGNARQGNTLPISILTHSVG